MAVDDRPTQTRTLYGCVHSVVWKYFWVPPGLDAVMLWLGKTAEVRTTHKSLLKKCPGALKVANMYEVLHMSRTAVVAECYGQHSIATLSTG